ncbi:MAG: M14 family zinc carboxypeptidase [Planctomycetota bacterium]
MRCRQLLVLLLTFSGPFLPCQTAMAENHPDHFYVQIDNLDRNDRVDLTRKGVDIASVRGPATIAYVTTEQLAALRARGLTVTVLPDSRPDDSGLLVGYHTHAELGTELQTIASTYPSIATLYNIGNSTQGRALWMMKISDNVNVEEDEPEFRYISSMHGDEVIGMELCLKLVQLLTSSYGTDPQITNLVDNVEIWILPLMNPDGYTAGGRYNAQGIDLNRNFPDRVADPTNTTSGRATEVRHVMNWGFAHSPVLSANFHGGAQVVNYPYDSDPNWYANYSATPDDALIRDLSLAYSSLNYDMYHSLWFTNGIVNGVEWYMIYGGMQDWNYVWQGCVDLTIELDDNKWPSYSTINGHWNDNRPAMLAYMEKSLTGVRGLVTDSVSGQPVDAKVRLVGINHDVFTDPDVGDYHRLARPGTYSFLFAADGYVTQTVGGVSVGSGAATRLDVALVPAGYTDLGNGLAGTGGQVPVLAGGGPLAAGSSNQVNLSNALPGATTYLVVGVALAYSPMKGGILVPSPWVILPGLPVDGSGMLNIPFNAPAGASSGTRFYVQHWITDAGGPAGFSASNGLEAEIQ